jgi:hypothetical protein
VALIKYGPLADEVSGTVGGVTFARVHGAKAARTWRAPVNKRRPLQRTQRAILAGLPAIWQTLTPAQRAAWDAYAATCEFTNPLGQPLYLTGYNMCIRNILIAESNWPGTSYPYAPTATGFPTTPAIVWYLSVDDGHLEMNTWPGTPNAWDRLRISWSPIRPATQIYPWRLYHGKTTILGAVAPGPIVLETFSWLINIEAGKHAACLMWYFEDYQHRISQVHRTVQISETS